MEGESEEGEGTTTPLLAAGSANDGASHTYVPPHLREGRTSQNQERLRKTVQGLINRCRGRVREREREMRVPYCSQLIHSWGLTCYTLKLVIFSHRLSESNMQPISSQLEQMYRENSRNG